MTDTKAADIAAISGSMEAGAKFLAPAADYYPEHIEVANAVRADSAAERARECLAEVLERHGDSWHANDIRDGGAIPVKPEDAIAAMLAFAARGAASEDDVERPMTVIDPEEWEPCSPAYLDAGGSCRAPRVWNEASKNHWHPRLSAMPDGVRREALEVPYLDPPHAEDHPLLKPIIEKRARAAGNVSPEFNGQRGQDFDRGLLCAFEAMNAELQRLTNERRSLATNDARENGDG